MSRDKFVEPTPEDLKHHHYPSDRIKPSQSKRWTDPSVIRSTAAPPSASPHLPHRSSSQKTANNKQGRRDGESPPAANGLASDSRRGTSRRAMTSEKPDSSRSKVSGSGVKSRRGSTSSDDETPPPATLHAPPKKRSTMNSRDAAYEAAIQASLIEAGVKGDRAGQRDPSARSETVERDDGDVSMDEGEEEEGTHRRGVKRSRGDFEDVNEEEHIGDRSDGGKIRRVSETGDTLQEGIACDKKLNSCTFVADSSSVNSQGVKRSRPLPPVPGSKPKHPNQYTYRANKQKEREHRQQAERETREKEERDVPPPPVPAHVAPPPPPSTMEKKRPAKVPAEATRKADKEKAIARDSTPESRADPTPLGPLNWGLPDHLQPFSHLLPDAHPQPLALINPPTVDRRTGTIKEKDDSYGNGVAPPVIRYEPPTKVKFPGKRMTVGEMRKRVRSVLEYVGRIQVEEVKRGERAKMLGLEDNSTEQSGPSSARDGSSVDIDPKSGADDTSQPDPKAQVASGPSPSTDNSIPTPLSKSMQLMDDLTRELIKFQEKFESNGSWFAPGNNVGNGGAGDAEGMDVDN